MKPGIYVQHRFLQPLFSTLIVVYLGALGPACAGRPPGPRVIGAVETLTVVDAGLRFRARIDTGAGASSIHATGIRLDGSLVHFVLENERGERRALTAPVVDVAQVRTAQGVDVRPRVVLRLRLLGVEKAVRVSLRDRSAMQDKLLVGRDFLAGDFVVDVAR